VWIPLATWAHVAGEPGRLTGEEHWLTTIAQLKPGMTMDRARAIAAAAGQAVHSVPGQQTRLRSIGEWRLSGQFMDAMIAGAGALGVGLLVLALACTNVANLLIARAAARRREMSVRMALGGTRARIARLWLTESGLLCGGAGALSFLVAWWLLELLVAFRPPVHIGHADAPALPFGFQIDLRVFVFTLGLASLTAAAVGLIAARQASPDRVRAFSPGANTRSAIIALQMALSLLLLLPCGLFVRSWLNASVIDTGFSTDGVLLLPISARQPGVTVRKPPAFDEQLAARVRALPGVQAAAVMDPVPLWFGGNTASFAIDRPSGRASFQMGFQVVTPGYFETLQIPLLRGRDFTPADHAAAPHVAIVNETMARRFWPNGDALGQRIRNRDAVIEIVGIARDAKYLTLGEQSRPWLYRPLAQRGSDNSSLSLAVRTSGDPLRLRMAVEREVRALMPGWPSFQFRTLDEGLQLQRALPRAAATLLGALGLFGMGLAAIGIYGVMAYVVRQRTKEIAIRMAMGAPIASVFLLVIKQGMAVCAVGAGVGVAVALVATRFLGSVLYGIGTSDPLTFVAVPGLLLAVALLACYLPARAISRVNPLVALRDS
jgi:macrolide transport system ATP-binding/permease protein